MLKALRQKSEKAGPNVLLEGFLNWLPSPHHQKMEVPLGWDGAEVAGRGLVLEGPNKTQNHFTLGNRHHTDSKCEETG